MGYCIRDIQCFEIIITERSPNDITNFHYIIFKVKYQNGENALLNYEENYMNSIGKMKANYSMYI